MNYQISFEILPNITEDAPTSEEILLPFGDLVEVAIFFPWGCGGLTHVRILQNESQIYPTTPGEYFAGNDILIKFESRLRLIEAWNRFKIEGYNRDDTETHTPIVSFVVLPRPRGFVFPPPIVGV